MQHKVLPMKVKLDGKYNKRKKIKGMKSGEAEQDRTAGEKANIGS